MGKIYFFTPPSASKQLIIKEYDPAAKIELELLDGTKGSKWQGNMQVRLFDLYSHWLCRDQEMLLLRPIEFWDRRIKYSAKYLADSMWEFYEVPLHKQNVEFTLSHLKEMLVTSKEYRQLVLLKEDVPNNRAILDIFGKVEDMTYVEFYLDYGSLLTVSLPRFQLSFVLSRSKKRKVTEVGDFESTEFSEYILCNCQQLDDCFDNFTSYMLLRKRSELKLLLPKGDVVRSEGKAWVKCHESASNSKRAYYSYDAHERFDYFQAPDISSRLYLALIFCASSTLLPCKRYNATGAEVALDLVRKC
jgi:hypothetical protein